MKLHDLSCDDARAHLSARLDGEALDAPALDAHLARCTDCRAHERALRGLARDFAVLRTTPAPDGVDLWPALARRARARPRPTLLARAAAALVGFASVALAARMLERAPRDAAPRARHLLERLAPSPTRTVFATLPEYRVLRAFPSAEEPR